MIGQATCHRWSQQHFSSSSLSKGFSSTQLMMWPAEVVRTAKAATSAFQSRQAPGRMPTLARQAGEELSHGPVQAEGNGGIEHRSSMRNCKQSLCLFQRSLDHLSRDLHH